MQTDQADELLAHIINDLAADTDIAHSCLKAAKAKIKVGLADEALELVLEAEPKLFDAQKLVNLATYTDRLRQGVKGLSSHD